MSDQPAPNAARLPSTAEWDTDAWRQEATRWIDANLERRGVTRYPTLPRQPRIRPWGTQLVVDTDRGRVWFKAAPPASGAEPALYRLLTDVAPDLLPPLWASDPEQGWLLMPDAGSTLREVATSETFVGVWAPVLRRYARLQRASVAAVDRLTDAGMPRYEPHDLVRAWSRRRVPDTRLDVPTLRAAANRLEALGLPLTVQHDDLHAGNVFCAGATPSDAQAARFFDWGDAYLGNPLCSLLIALRAPMRQYGLPDDPERDRRLVRAYAGGWSDRVSSSAILSVLPDALLLARVGRILSWDRALVRASDAERAQWQLHVDAWTGEILEETRPDPA